MEINEMVTVISEGHLAMDVLDAKAIKVGQSILDAITKKDLTYEEAYAGLEFAARALKFSSNFVQIQPDHTHQLVTRIQESQAESSRLRHNHKSEVAPLNDVDFKNIGTSMAKNSSSTKNT